MIIVTGMHRSGTSLAALVLQALGADFGPEHLLYGADDWNADGYLERLDVVDLNSRAITGFARTTGRVSAALSQVSYLRMPGPAAIERRLEPLGEEIRAAAGRLDGLTVKDPRFCLTLPGWQEAGPSAGVVVALRHPSAAVASLRRRNRLPLTIGHRFWHWHMSALLPHLDDATLVLRQDRLTGPDASAEVDRAAAWLEERGIDARGDASRVIDRGLVHHRPDDTGVPSANLELWERLLAAPSYEA